MSFGIYLTGCVVVIAGLIYGASLMHVPTQWMVVSGLPGHVGFEYQPPASGTLMNTATA